MTASGPTPAVILVAPQLGENVGAVARAMLNCGLERLRLVRPRHGWPNASATPAAAGADQVLEGAVVFDTTHEAVADLTRVYAMTARLRDMIKPVLTPRQAAKEMWQATAAGEQIGLLFGPERTGLDNEDVVLAQSLVHVPLNPDFSSLNLAQAVLLVAYEWRMASDGVSIPRLREARMRERGATQDELVNFFSRLEGELDRGGFFEVADKKPALLRNIRNIFTRSGLTDQELSTLHGIVTALIGKGAKRAAQDRRDDP